MVKVNGFSLTNALWQIALNGLCTNTKKWSGILRKQTNIGPTENIKIPICTGPILISIGPISNPPRIILSKIIGSLFTWG